MRTETKTKEGRMDEEMMGWLFPGSYGTGSEAQGIKEANEMQNDEEIG